MTVETLQELQLFEYSKHPTTTESFDEVKVTLSFRFGKKDPDTHAGRSWPIKNSDEAKMEAESFYEAAVKAWDKYSKSAYITRAEFVRQKLADKWIELNGTELTGKILKFT